MRDYLGAQLASCHEPAAPAPIASSTPLRPSPPLSANAASAAASSVSATAIWARAWSSGPRPAVPCALRAGQFWNNASAAFVGRLGAADHDGQGAVDSAALAARDGRVEVVDARLRQPLGDRALGGLGDGAHVDNRLPLVQRRFDPRDDAFDVTPCRAP